MQRALKTRLIGAAVLVAIAVIVVPTFFSAKPPGDTGHSISLNIPAQPDAQFQTRILSVGPGSGTSAAQAAPAASVPVIPQSATPPGVAVQPVPAVSAGAPPVAAAKVPPAPAPVASVASAPAAATPAPTKPKTKPAPPGAPGRAANVVYWLRLGAYANHSSADKVQAQAALAGYRTQVQSLAQGGKTLTRVSAGPFSTKAAAEAARLRLDARLSGVKAKVDTVARVAQAQHGSAPAPTAKSAKSAKSVTQAGGYAVQVIAYSQRSDADALRKRLHAAGFEAYVDSVTVHGKTLWRVRVGPRIKRSDAVTLQAAITARFPKLKGEVVSVP